MPLIPKRNKLKFYQWSQKVNLHNACFSFYTQELMKSVLSWTVYVLQNEFLTEGTISTSASTNKLVKLNWLDTICNLIIIPSESAPVYIEISSEFTLHNWGYKHTDMAQLVSLDTMTSCITLCKEVDLKAYRISSPTSPRFFSCLLIIEHIRTHQ